MSGAPGLRFYKVQNIGPTSNATNASRVSARNEDLTVYLFVSSYNSVNTTPYRFKTYDERLKYNLGQAFAIGGANIQD